MAQNLEIEKQSSFARAGDIEESATMGVEQTYLGQLAAEGQLVDLMENEQTTLGSLEASASAGGIKSPVRLEQVLQDQFGEQKAEARQQIDTSRDIGVIQYGNQRDQAGRLREQFSEGSAFMNLYNYQRERIQGATDLQEVELNAQNDYLDELIEDQNYNTGWFMVDLFDFAGSAGDIASIIKGR